MVLTDPSRLRLQSYHRDTSRVIAVVVRLTGSALVLGIFVGLLPVRVGVLVEDTSDQTLD